MHSRGNWVRFGALALVWGSSFLWIKLGLGSFSPVQVALLRMAIGALVIVGLCVTTGIALPRDRSVWLHMLVPAFFGSALPFTLFAVGERTVSTGVAGVLNSTTPIWVLLIALTFRFEKRPSVVRLTGLGLGMAGTVLIFAPWQASGLMSWGALACLGAAICYAVSYNYLSRVLAGRLAPTALAAAQLSLGAGLATLSLPVLGRQAVHLSPWPAVAVVVLGVAGTGVAFVWNNRLIADEGPTAASSVTYVVPVVSVLLGVIALGEPLNVRVLAGMVVVLVGVALSRKRAAKAESVQVVTPRVRISK